MHNPRVTRLFLWYNKSVRLRNKFAHGDNEGKKTQYSKQMMAEALKSRAAFFNSGVLSKVVKIAILTRHGTCKLGS
jgi:hypothetical protein